MGRSGFDGQKYHMRHKPKKPFNNVKNYQSTGSHDAKLEMRASNSEITFKDIFCQISLGSFLWTDILIASTILFSIYVAPKALTFLIKDRPIDYSYPKLKQELKDKEQAYGVLMRGGTNGFNQSYFEYTIKEVGRAHRLFPYRTAPRYMLAVSYSELCITKKTHCDKAEYYSQLFLERSKNDPEWEVQRKYVEELAQK